MGRGFSETQERQLRALVSEELWDHHKRNVLPYMFQPQPVVIESLVVQAVTEIAIRAFGLVRRFLP
jgi:hypothetical protein